VNRETGGVKAVLIDSEIVTFGTLVVPEYTVVGTNLLIRLSDAGIAVLSTTDDLAEKEELLLSMAFPHRQRRLAA
jgi:hypothetical protein